MHVNTLTQVTPRSNPVSQPIQKGDYTTTFRNPFQHDIQTEQGQFKRGNSQHANAFFRRGMPYIQLNT